jgi:hypothetical protein
MKILQTMSICLVGLAGGVLSTASSAWADDCALATDAAIAQAKVPHADTHVTTESGKPPASIEMIITGDKAYTQINGAWKSMAFSSQEQIDIINAAKARAAQKPRGCQKQGGQTVDGQAASLLTMHADDNGKVSDARIWIADATGLPLKSEAHLANGTVIVDTFRYDNIQPPPGVK